MLNKIFFILIVFSLMIFSCLKDKPIPDITTGLVAYFPLNGSALDSVNNISGVNYNAVAAKNRNGIEGMAMSFNHDDTSYIDFGDHPNYSFTNNQFTINCWLNTTDTSFSGAILSKRTPSGPYEYSLDNHFKHAVFNLDNWPADGSGCVYGVDPLKSSAPLKLNGWQMITYAADGNLLRVYVNGVSVLNVEVDAYNSNKFLSDTNAPLMFGVGGGWGVNYYFTGSIDDVKFYNRVLTDEQMKYLFQK